MPSGVKRTAKREALVVAGYRVRADEHKGKMREAYVRGDTKAIVESLALIRYYENLCEEATHAYDYMFDPRKHPRDRLGKFREVLGMLDKAPRGSEILLPGGYSITRGFRRYKVKRGSQVIGSGQGPDNVLRAYEQAQARARQVDEFDQDAERRPRTRQGRPLTDYEVSRRIEGMGAFD